MFQKQALKALANSGQEWAELDVLRLLADAVVSGQTVDPVVQQVANVIVARAVLRKRLPGEKRGRPPDDSENPFSATRMYFTLFDGGASRQEALGAVEKQFPTVGRNIERWIKKNKDLIGATPEEREQTLTWMTRLDEGQAKDVESAAQQQEPDYETELEQLLAKLLQPYCRP